MDQTVLVVGNETDRRDSAAVAVADQLSKYFPHLRFIHWDPTEELPPGVSEDLVLIDSVVGITDVTVYDSLDTFSVSPRNTVHDFDLPVSLGLLQKLGKVKKLTLIGIPAEGNVRKLAQELRVILSAI